MTDITIPPEALEAAARALALENETRENLWPLYEGKARAACLAMLKAWPGMWVEQLYPVPVATQGIILPLPQEAIGE